MKPIVDREKIKSILVIRFERLGDLILVMTLLQNLRLAFPGARLTLLCQDIYADFLSRQPGVDAVVAIPRKRASARAQLRGWFGAVKALLTNSYDLVIDVSDNNRSAQLVRLTRARLRMGFWPPTRWPPRRSWFEAGVYNCYAPILPYETEAHGHFVNLYLAPLAALGLPILQPTPTLRSTAADQTALRELLSELKLDDRRYAVIHPGARTPNRRWPAENYPPVIEHLANRGVQVAMIGEAGESAIAAEIAALSSVSFNNLVGRLTLGQLAALLERCCLFIGNNTGPIHIAAGVGARIVAIYGIHAVMWSPLTDRHIMVTPQRPCHCVDPATCRPTDPDGSLCVQRNSVADVLRAIDIQLSTEAAAAR
jgi:ADP-heptose:LPS heptosyltransferase